MTDTKRKKVSVYISAEEHLDADVRMAREKTSFQSVMYDGFVNWLRGGRQSIQPVISRFEQSYIDKLLFVLRSDHKDCRDAVTKNLEVFEEFVQIKKPPPGTLAERKKGA